MRRDETIVLWKKSEDGRAAALAEGKGESEAHQVATAIWNRWANDMLVRKTELEKAGIWRAEQKMRKVWSAATNMLIDNCGPINKETRRWMEDASADFSRIKFVPRTASALGEQQDEADTDKTAALQDNRTQPLIIVVDSLRCDGWKFPGVAGFGAAQFSVPANFERAQFNEAAGFYETQFHDQVWFKEAEFHGDAVFHHAQFRGSAGFIEAQFRAAFFYETHFHGSAWFYDTKFARAGFELARFDGFATFRDASFEGGADFFAVRSEGGFEMERAKFEELPGFIQASFKEAPRLDDIALGPKVEPGSFWRSLFVKSSMEVTSRHRALKRLAIQGHDHEREHLFFKGELRARRTSEDRWWYSRYLIGIFYDLVSGFGRSVWRPMLVWLLWAALLAELYALSAVPRVAHTPAAPSVVGSAPLALNLPPNISCRPALWEGLYLAARNGFPLSGARDQRVINGYSCLYSGAPPSDGTFPVIPPWISYAELVHMLGSVSLIFLIVLALRNQFKIK